MVELEVLADTIVTIAIILGFLEYRLRPMYKCIKRLEQRLDEHLDRLNKEQK